MLKVVLTKKFCKDLKRMEKRGYKLSLLKDVVHKLEQEETLPAKYKDHALIGDYSGFRECHIQPEHIQIYFDTHKYCECFFMRKRRWNNDSYKMR